MLKILLAWHRRLALLCVFPFVIWTLSGLLHPAMSHFAKAPHIKPDPIKVESNRLQNYIHLKDALKQQGVHHFSHASLVEFKGNYFYQVQQQIDDGTTVHYLPLSATSVSLNDVDYARYLATQWTNQNVIKSELVTQFSSAYPEINRVLPVYRLHMDSGNNIYIDTLGKRITAHNTPLRESLSFWFKQLHTWQFAGDRHSLWRIIPMLLISIAVLVMAIFGLLSYSVLWSRIKTKQLNRRSLHRASGLALSLCMLGFASSSTHILIDKFFLQEFRDLSPTNQIATDAIHHDPVKTLAIANGHNFQLVIISGQVLSQIVSYKNNSMHFTYWQNNQTQYDDKAFAQSALLNQLNIKGTLTHSKKIDKFGPTYGFVNKRLPVLQLSFEQSPEVRYSIELHTGYIAAVDDTWQNARSWHFGYLHKYHFLNPLGKDIRDSIITLICLGLAFIALLGTSMYFSKLLRQRRAKIHRNIQNNEILEITKEQA
ncbi:PepSY domain-containing protein [Pseudoalteromonas luteoviolacea]|uniref:PepSY domain-containing protein n=1 Tax=Pseudoalteromonas luteoviolacea TaxID=43657 RepID=UPI001B36BFDF|nr:PepSY domain-containing protein [Pseudoalteromonas luteoviolacea]MBQ4835636.1 PepSY domain-containing protein [Pseudoalteromonas luteoviolacea]